MATSPFLGFPGLRKSYTCAEPVVAGPGLNAGIVVERRTGTDLIGLAADASRKVAGVCIDDVPAARATVTGHQVGDGHEATVYSGGFVNVVASAIVAEGASVCASANGQVRTWVTGTDAADSLVGYADQAAAAGAVVRIFVRAGGH